LHKILGMICLFILFGFQSVGFAAEATTAREQQIESNIQPVGQVNIAGQQSAAAAGGATAVLTPQQHYDNTCKLCHGPGLAGAPAVGNKGQWAPRVAEGLDTLVQHAIQGYKGMPARGTCATCSDADIKAIVELMVNQSK